MKDWMYYLTYANVVCINSIALYRGKNPLSKWGSSLQSIFQITEVTRRFSTYYFLDKIAGQK